jgi:hypothetical protein
MSIPTPSDPNNPDFKPLPTDVVKPNVKDFDDKANWITSSTNPSIECNVITGKLRTKDFSKPHNYPKGI